MTTLTCAGKSKAYGLGCHQLAVWAVTSATRTVWTGACHHHIHQILKTVEGETAMQVIRAERLRDGSPQIRPARLLQEMITHRGGDWTWARANSAFYQTGHQHSNKECREFLDALEDEGVVVRVGGSAQTPVYRRADDEEWQRLGTALTLLIAIREHPGQWTVERALGALREQQPYSAEITEEAVLRDLERLSAARKLHRVAPDTWTLPVYVPTGANPGTPISGDSSP